MKLHLPQFIQNLRYRPMTLIADHGVQTLDATHPNRVTLAKVLLPHLETAGKYIFDSGSDIDKETTDAINATSSAMMEDGHFHLPHPAVWIEDPYAQDTSGETRLYLLAIEDSNIIRFWVINRSALADRQRYPEVADYIFSTMSGILRLHEPHSGHFIAVNYPPGHPQHQAECFKTVTIALRIGDYALRKFLVTLNAGGVTREAVAGTRRLVGKKQRPTGDYPYTIVRIPLEATTSANDNAVGAGSKRRRGFVRGYVWGKNTRPREQQRWIEGHFRGCEELGTVEHSHYQVASVPLEK